MNRNWEITMRFYPGLLIGVRTYEEKEFNEHVLYLPFCVDIALKIDK
jgi:hypothetical protein